MIHSNEKQLKLEQFLNQTQDSLEDIRKRLIAALETSIKIKAITDNPHYEHYLQECQKRGLLTDTTVTILKQQEVLLTHQAFLNPNLKTKNRP